MLGARGTRGGAERWIGLGRGLLGGGGPATCGGRCGAWQPSEVIWPAWDPTFRAASGAGASTVTALERVHDYWDGLVSHTRGSYSRGGRVGFEQITDTAHLNLSGSKYSGETWAWRISDASRGLAGMPEVSSEESEEGVRMI